MGNALKKARRAKQKAKQGRIERAQIAHNTKVDSYKSEFIEEMVCDDPQTIDFFKTLPCPIEQAEQCLELIEDYVAKKFPIPPDDDDFITGVIIHAAMYKSWVETGEASFVITP